MLETEASPVTAAAWHLLVNGELPNVTPLLLDEVVKEGEPPARHTSLGAGSVVAKTMLNVVRHRQPKTMRRRWTVTVAMVVRSSGGAERDLGW
jgi:hypothetical protein